MLTPTTLYSWLLLLVLFMGTCPTVSAADETITFSDKKFSNGEAVGVVQGNQFTIAFSQGTNSTTPKYYTTGAAVRAYAGNTVTIASTTKTIAKIEFTFGSGDGSNSITSSTGSYSNGTWTGSAQTVVFTIGGASGHRRFASVAVTYQPDFVLTATANDDNWGTVTVSGSVITASPYEGYRVSTSTPYTITSGSAIVQQNDNEFTVSATSDCSVQINFEAIPAHTVTWYVNGTTTTEELMEGTSIAFPSAPEGIYGKCFVGWTATAIDGVTDDVPLLVSTAIMDADDMTFYAVFADRKPGGETIVTDVLTRSTTGVSSSASYTDWQDRTATSTAVYAGNSAGGHSSIQLRSGLNGGHYSGIVTTASGGKLQKVTVDWNMYTVTGRVLNIYGSNTAYTKVEDVHSGSKQGTLLGTLVKGTSTELTISGDYQYIGMYCENDALFLNSVSVDWLTISSDTYAGYCTTVTAPVYTQEVGSHGWATYVTPDVAVQFAFGDAYVVCDADADRGIISLAAVTSVPARTPVLLKGQGTKTITAVDEAMAPERNLLMVSDGIFADGVYPYVLVKDGEGAGFMRWTGDAATLKGRVVLPLSFIFQGGARMLLIDLNDEATGIETVQTFGKQGDASHHPQTVYDLKGCRLNCPAKGLNIVDGQKVVVR